MLVQESQEIQRLLKLLLILPVLQLPAGLVLVASTRFNVDFWLRQITMILYPIPAILGPLLILTKIRRYRKRIKKMMRSFIELYNKRKILFNLLHKHLSDIRKQISDFIFIRYNHRLKFSHYGSLVFYNLFDKFMNLVFHQVLIMNTSLHWIIYSVFNQKRFSIITYQDFSLVVYIIFAFSSFESSLLCFKSNMIWWARLNEVHTTKHFVKMSIIFVF